MPTFLGPLSSSSERPGLAAHTRRKPLEYSLRGRSSAAKRPDVQDDRSDVPLVERVPPGRHQAGEADTRAAAADGVGEVGVRLALLEGRVAEVARMRIEVERIESVARSGVTVAADAISLKDLFAELQLVSVW